MHAQEKYISIQAVTNGFIINFPGSTVVSTNSDDVLAYFNSFINSTLNINGTFNPASGAAVTTPGTIGSDSNPSVSLGSAGTSAH